jgi:hypothetical protein
MEKVGDAGVRGAEGDVEGTLSEEERRPPDVSAALPPTPTTTTAAGPGASGAGPIVDVHRLITEVVDCAVRVNHPQTVHSCS